MKPPLLVINTPVNNQPVRLCSTLYRHMCYKYFIPIVDVVYSLNGKIHVELFPRVKNNT